MQGIIIKSIERNVDLSSVNGELYEVLPTRVFEVRFLIVLSDKKIESKTVIRDIDDLSFEEAKKIVARQIKDSLK